MTDEVPMGKLYFPNRLYGDDMVRLKAALAEAGFRLNIDPLQDQADLVKIEEPDPFDGDGEGLIPALEASDAHPDVAEYVRRCREAGEDTGVLNSMRTFHRGGEGDIAAWYDVGTRKETVLWDDGAEVALEEIGNWDVTNRPILETIVDDGDADA